MSDNRFIQRGVIPSPEVQHLTTIFRRIQSGEIRVPAFQRGFVWRDNQVIDLLNSVYKGYPVGSLLLWKAERLDDLQVRTVDASVQFDDLPSYPFPRMPVPNAPTYLLDGVQRLSALYGAFFEPTINETFDVAFDLESSIFQFTREIDLSNPKFVRLADLFTPKRLIEAQQKMASSTNGDSLIDASLLLQASFQDYLMPIVNIVSSNIDEVVEIFERVNSTGTRLSRLDFMRALTWSGGFDLNTALQSLQDSFSSTYFRFSPETLTKVIAIILGKDPTPRSMIEMRKEAPATLNAATESCHRVMSHVIEFLSTRCAILSSDFVPYEGQMLVLAKLFHVDPNPSEPILRHIENWFWSTSFSETLRGKPDSYVTAYIRSIDDLLQGNDKILIQRLLLRPEDLYDRRMIVTKALSSAVATMFSVNKAHSLISGLEISKSDYMQNFNADNYFPVLSTDRVKRVFRELKGNSPRILANMCVVSREEREFLLDKNTSLEETLLSLRQRFDEGQVKTILESQLISEDAYKGLLSGDYRMFLLMRAFEMFNTVTRLTHNRKEYGG